MAAKHSREPVQGIFIFSEDVVVRVELRGVKGGGNIGWGSFLRDPCNCLFGSRSLADNINLTLLILGGVIVP